MPLTFADYAEKRLARLQQSKNIQDKLRADMLRQQFSKQLSVQAAKELLDHKEKLKFHNAQQESLRPRFGSDLLEQVNVDNDTVTFPESEVIQNPKTGLFEEKMLDEDKKSDLLMTKLSQTLESGQPLSGAMAQVYGKLKARKSKTMKMQDSSVSRKPSELKAYLEFLTDENKNPEIGTPKNDQDIAQTILEYRKSMGADVGAENEDSAPLESHGTQSQDGTSSPYKDYPDAFLENGKWKVIRNGKRYRLEA